MSKMYDLFKNKSLENFGMALRLSIREHEDYASLIEFEYVEKEDQFIQVLKKFLRRYDSHARVYERKEKRGAFRPSEADLDKLVQLAEIYGVDSVCAALVSHALVKVG